MLRVHAEVSYQLSDEVRWDDDNFLPRLIHEILDSDASGLALVTCDDSSRHLFGRVLYLHRDHDGHARVVVSSTERPTRRKSRRAG